MSQGIEELNFEFHKLRAGPKTSNENLSMMETFVFVECVIHLFGCVHLRSELDTQSERGRFHAVCIFLPTV